MAAKHASVKLSTDLLNVARREAETFNRSLGAQVEHWARIGRLAETAPGIGAAEVQRLLDGTFRVEDLPPTTRAAFWEHMRDAFMSPDDEAQAYYAQLASREGAVGRDDQGRLVRRDADGQVRPVSG